MCPYLIADDGAWRSARPSRDHRCGAVTPAAPLALDKQRRLCLAKAHATCVTRLAAIGEALADDAGDGAGLGDRRSPVPSGATRWSLVRTAPVVLDRGGRLAAGGHRVPGTVGQWALGTTMALALGALALARLPEPAPASDGSPAVLAATGEPAAAAATIPPASSADVSRTAGASGSGRAPAAGLATPGREPRPSPTPSPTASAVSAGGPSAGTPTVHVVRAGDTLYQLARAYETTVEALQAANELGASTTLHVGQELVVP